MPRKKKETKAATTPPRESKTRRGKRRAAEEATTTEAPKVVGADLNSSILKFDEALEQYKALGGDAAKSERAMKKASRRKPPESRRQKPIEPPPPPPERKRATPRKRAASPEIRNSASPIRNAVADPPRGAKRSAPGESAQPSPKVSLSERLVLARPAKTPTQRLARESTALGEPPAKVAAKTPYQRLARKSIVSSESPAKVAAKTPYQRLARTSVVSSESPAKVAALSPAQRLARISTALEPPKSVFGSVSSLRMAQPSEEMDWDVIVQEVNQHIESRNITSDSGEKLNEIKSLDCTYAIVDTNIFLSHLELIRRVSSSAFANLNIILVVPWRVIRELDGLKKDSKFSFIGREVLSFLHQNLKSNCRVSGQSLQDANNHIFPCHNADDEVLNCCLQYLMDKKNVILLSNDKNLRTKALINKVRAYNHEEFSDEIESVSPTFRQTSNKTNEIKSMDVTESDSIIKVYEDIQESITNYLSDILQREMKVRYGDLWLNIVLHKPPWNLNNILECLLKHWIAVFSETLPKNAQNVIKELKFFFPKRRNAPLSNVDDLKAVANACIQLIKFFQVHDAYMAISHDCAKEIRVMLGQILKEKESSGKYVNNRSTSSHSSSTVVLNYDITHSNVALNDSIECDASMKLISDVFLLVWNAFTSYCCQLANHLGVPHCLTSNAASIGSLNHLIEQADSVKNQIQMLIASLSSVLVSHPIEEHSPEYKKIKANASVQELFVCLNSTVVGLGKSGLSFNESDLKSYCSGNLEILEDGFNKFTLLNRLLEECSVQYSNIQMQQ